MRRSPRGVPDGVSWRDRRAKRTQPRRLASYLCLGSWETGGPLCAQISGQVLDPLVTSAMLQRLTAPSFTDVQAALRRGHREYETALRLPQDDAGGAVFDYEETETSA